MEKPEKRFYDVDSSANVALKPVVLQKVRVWLVVVFTVAKEGVHVVTVYPVEDVGKEVGRKVNSGRWIMLEG